VRFGTIVVCGGGCYGGYYVRQLARAVAAGAATVERILVVDRDPLCRVRHLVDAIGHGDRIAMQQHAWRQRRVGVDEGDAVAVNEYVGLPIEFVAMEWEPFFQEWFGAAIEHPERAGFDAVVPSPLMPHLLADWVAHRLRVHRPDGAVARVAMRVVPETPWRREGADLAHYASFATWMCPINCIEPPRCPETRGPRDWTMPLAVRAAVAAAEAQGEPYHAVIVFHTTHRVFGVGMFDVADAIAADAEVRVKAVRRTTLHTLVASVSHCHGAMAVLRSEQEAI